MAQLTHSVAANGRINSPDYKYLHKDHLGSITGITHGAGSQKGQLYRRMAFDPWGARRDLPGNKLSNNALSPSSILASYAKTTKFETNRGFTGHEMLDEVGIIHMNGRIYDASIGRFLQADPHVDGAASVGGFNRYAYVKNNPLNATDPTGYFSLRKALKRAWNDIRPFVGAIVSAVLIVTTAGAGGLASGWFLSSWYGAATLGAISGAAGAAANGANLRGVLSAAAFGAASGAAFYGVGQAFKEGVGVLGAYGAKTFGGFAGRVLAHGAVGGVMSVLQGGKFGHGFASASIAKGFSLGAQNLNANIYGQFAAAAIAGGTASEATGGKFANGAQSAALAFLVNQAASSSAGAVKGAIAQKSGHAGRIERRFEKRMQEMLKTGNAGAGHELTYKEAIWWWRNANGATLTVDGRELSVINIGGEFAAPFPLDDLKVHGHVTTNPANGRIYDGMYDFEPRVMPNPNNQMKITIRNMLNEAAIKQHGAGTPFEIQYRYEDSDF